MVLSRNPYGSAGPKRNPLYTSGGGGGGGGSFGGGGQPDTTDPFNGPGSIDFDLTDPQKAVTRAVTESGDVFSGLRTFLFGTDKPDVSGQHGGVLGVGNVPIIGDVLRGVSAVPGAIGQAASTAIGAVASLPERISLPAQEAEIRQSYAALPDSSPAKIAAEAEMKADTGLLGTGFLNAHLTAMNKAVEAHKQNENPSPELLGGLFRPVGSLADVFSNMFGVLSAPQRLIERQFSGATNRLAEIRAVAAGTGTFRGGQKGLNAQEQIALEKTQTGEWTDNQANDFLASHGAGISHDPLWEIAGVIALDPMVFGSLGAGAVAKLGRTGVTLNQFLGDAQKALAAERALGASADANKISTLERAVANASAGIRSGQAAENVGRLNVVGKVARTQAAGDIARTFGRAYASLEGNAFGRMASVTRDILDPTRPLGRGWSAMRGSKAEAAIQEGAIEVQRAVISAHGGELGHNATLYRLNDTLGRTFVDQFSEGLGIYSAHVLRRVAGWNYRRSQLLGKAGELLRGVFPDSVLDDVLSKVNKRTLVQLEEEAGKYVRRAAWAEADKENLALRASVLMKGRTQEEWLAEFAHKTWTPEALSELHAATYGMMVKQLAAAKAAIRASGDSGALADKLHRLTLLNKQTLTTLGHEGIMTRLGEQATLDGKLAEIEASRLKYPELRDFKIDPTSKQATIDSFTEMMARKKNYLPGQITEAERSAGLPGALADLDAETREIFTIGFRPEDQFLWGLERDGEGILHEVGDPWFDEVSTIPNSYNAVRDLSFNVAGMPLAAKGARVLDAVEAAGRMAMHGVTGKMVSQVAHQKFTGSMQNSFKDMSGEEAETIWKALMDKVDDSTRSGGALSGVRGLSVDAIWDAARKVIPQTAEHAGLDRRALMMHVLDAYTGDTRYFGLTQELTGQIKKLWFAQTGKNTMGEVAEHVWPLMKFRLNAFFQLQEKIEPWVLNAQRGAHVAWGTKLSEKDTLAAQVYKNFVEKDIVNMVDTDIAEYGKRFLLQKNLEKAAQQEGGVAKAFRQALDKIGAPDNLMDVQGVKQLNMLRTWEKNLGKTMRADWERAGLGAEWNDMLRSERLRLGEMISEDEFAVRMAAEKLAANNVSVQRILRADGSLEAITADFKNAISEGHWTAPQNIGELRALDLDGLFTRMGSIRDVDIKSANDVRRALAQGKVTMEDVQQGLRLLGAHPDYSARVESALTFSWPKFWGEVQTTFGLDLAQRTRLEDMFADFAKQSGMTPVEYISQIYSPVIAERGQGGVGSLGNIVEFMRGGRPETMPDLARLVGQQGASDAAALYAQMTRVMSHHLHPSAKLAFLQDIKGELDQLVADEAITMDLAEINRMFHSDEVQQALADRITNFMRGTPGTGAHTIVSQENTGVAFLRDAAHNWRTGQGRPASMTRVIMEDNPALARETADALDQMPRIADVATPADLTKRVALSDVIPSTGRLGPADIKQALRGYQPHDPVRLAYEHRLRQGRQLYRHLTEDLGVKVRPVRQLKPYASADAMRADLARKVLKVPDSGYWHPFYHNEDLFMQRAVADAFGYGPEATTLGSHDAFFRQAALYDDEARSVLFTDEFARDAWAAHSSEVIPTPVAKPATVAEYEARYGAAAPEPVSMETNFPGHYRLQSRTVGSGLRALPEPEQREIVTAFGELRDQFPNVGLEAIDVGPLDRSTAAATMYYGPDKPTVVLADHQWGASGQITRATRTARRMEKLQAGELRFTVSGDRTGDIYHEFGHLLDRSLREQSLKGKSKQAATDIIDFVDNLMNSKFANELSGYATKELNGVPHQNATELFGEMFDLAFNPANTEEAFGNPVIQQFRQRLEQGGFWKPNGTPAPVNALAGKTISEANAAGAGIRAEHRIGLLPQELRDRITQQFLGSGRYAEANPDVARMSAYLHDHMSGAMAHVWENGEASEFYQKFKDIGVQLPVSEHVPYNFTEARLMDHVTNSLAAKWEDAFRLQYFAQNRSMLQRSINHPMFGLYPASYMWGKIGPELVKFMAKEPFGMNTGAMLYSIADMQKAVAVQRRWDPAFDAQIEKLGRNPALSFLGYMLPATLWSVPSSYPAWMRDMANQGLANQQAVESGQAIDENNWFSPLTASIKKVVPYTTTIPWLGRVGDTLSGHDQQAVPQAATDFAGRPTQPKTDLSQHVSATDLGPQAQDWVADLTALFR